MLYAVYRFCMTPEAVRSTGFQPEPEAEQVTDSTTSAKFLRQGQVISFDLPRKSNLVPIFVTTHL